MSANVVLGTNVQEFEALDRGYVFHPSMVGEVRGVGMLAAVGFVQDKAEKRLFEPAGKVGQAVAAACLERGMIARAMPTMPHGDVLGFAPPLTLSRAEADLIAVIANAAVEAVADSLRQAAPLAKREPTADPMPGGS